MREHNFVDPLDEKPESDLYDFIPTYYLSDELNVWRCSGLPSTTVV